MSYRQYWAPVRAASRTNSPGLHASLVASFGSRGSREGHLDSANAVAGLSSGELLVVDTYNRRVQIFTSNGNFHRTVGLKHLKCPWGACSPQNGRFYVTNGDKRQVITYKDDGTFVHKFKVTAEQEPCAISVGVKSEKIVLTDAAASTMYIYNLQGDLLNSFEPDLPQENCPSVGDAPPIAEHISVGSDGRIYASFGSGSSQIYVYNCDGKLDFSFGCFATPAGVYVTPQNNVLVADREQRTVQLFSSEGKLLQELLSLAKGLQFYPHAVSLVDGNKVILCVSEDPFGSPSRVLVYALD